MIGVLVQLLNEAQHGITVRFVRVYKAMNPRLYSTVFVLSEQCFLGRQHRCDLSQIGPSVSV